MFYPALVIDIKNFTSYGYILVRSPVLNHGMTFDLLEKFPDSLENIDNFSGEGINMDIKAFLLSSLGGGRNYGLFALPQVGTKGLITFIDGRRNEAVWVGNLFEPIFNDQRSVSAVNIPSDKEEDGENTDGSLEKNSNLDGDEGTIIFRQKSTRVTDESKSINMQALNTENLLILDKDRVHINHYLRDEDLAITKKQSIKIDTTTEGEETISLKMEDNENETVSSISLTDSKISIDVTGEETKSFTLDNENGLITINSSDTAKIELDTDGNITIFSDGGTIKFDSAEAVEILGNSDSFVKYTDLKEIIDAFADHIHIAPNGPTQAPLTSGQAPIGSKIKSPLKNMKTEKVKTE